MNASKVSKVILGIVLIAAVLSIIPTVNVGGKVQSSLDTNGLGDDRAPRRIKALQNEYGDSKPMLAIASVVSIILLFFFSKDKIATKLVLVVILAISAGGFLYVENEFAKAVDTAYAKVMPLPDEMEEIAKGMPAEMDPNGADETVLTTLNVTGQLSQKQQEMVGAMYPIMEDSINAVMGASVIFLGMVSVVLLGMLVSVFQSQGGFAFLKISK